jgi:hypothetical protein
MLRYIPGSGFKRKASSLIIISGLIAILVHLFTASYMVSFDNGIYGIVAKDTYGAISNAQVKAQAYDTIPDNYTRYFNADIYGAVDSME